MCEKEINDLKEQMLSHDKNLVKLFLEKANCKSKIASVMEDFNGVEGYDYELKFFYKFKEDKIHINYKGELLGVYKNSEEFLAGRSRSIKGEKDGCGGSENGKECVNKKSDKKEIKSPLVSLEAMFRENGFTISSKGSPAVENVLKVDEENKENVCENRQKSEGREPLIVGDETKKKGENDVLINKVKKLDLNNCINKTEIIKDGSNNRKTINSASFTNYSQSASAFNSILENDLTNRLSIINQPGPLSMRSTWSNVNLLIKEEGNFSINFDAQRKREENVIEKQEEFSIRCRGKKKIPYRKNSKNKKGQVFFVRVSDKNKYPKSVIELNINHKYKRSSSANLDKKKEKMCGECLDKCEQCNIF